MIKLFCVFVAVIGMVFPQIGANLLLKGADSKEALKFVRILCALLIAVVLAANYFISRYAAY